MAAHPQSGPRVLAGMTACDLIVTPLSLSCSIYSLRSMLSDPYYVYETTCLKQFVCLALR